MVEQGWKQEHWQIHHQHCAIWSDNQDEWWQNNPDWQVFKENDTHLCVSPIQNEKRAEYYRAMHRRQFIDTNNCTDTYQRQLVGIGFAAVTSQLTL